MKSLMYILIWTILFVAFGFYVDNKIHDFTDTYESKVIIIENYVKQEDWEQAKYELDKYHKGFHKQKNSWYKLLDHQYFDSICLYLDILDGSIFSKDKAMSLEQIVHIKTMLSNILESEKCDLNHIF